MKLDRFGTLLDDYVNGALDRSTASRIETEVASSEDAQRELDEYRAMVEGLRGLPDTIEPERDLWSDIEPRLDAPPSDRPASMPRWILLAATLVVAAGLTFVAMPRRTPHSAPSAASEIATSLAVDAIPAAYGHRTPTTLAESDLLAATEELERALDKHRASLPPATLELVERNLEIIRGAIAEIQLAIERDPLNPELNRALVAYYQQKLALLEQVSRTAARL